MIDKICIQNFKPFKDVVVDLHPGLVAVTGDTDAGKSAFREAIEWPVTNRPLGDTMCSDWGGGTKVTQVVGGYIVTREKSSEGNIYTLSYEEGSEEHFETFKGFGASVPDRIADILNMGEVNFQGQHEPHFLISKTPREAAKVLNAVTDLSSIDKAITNINHIDGEEAKKTKKLKADYETLQTELAAYDFVPEFKKRVEEVEKLLLKYDQIKSRLDELVQITNKVRGLTNDLAKTRFYTRLKPLLEEVQGLIAFEEGVAFKLEALNHSVSIIKQLQQRKAALLENAASLKRQLYTGAVCPLCKGKGRLMQLDGGMSRSQRVPNQGRCVFTRKH